MYMVGHAINDADRTAGFLKPAAEVKMDRFLDRGLKEGDPFTGGPDRMDPDPR